MKPYGRIQLLTALLAWLFAATAARAEQAAAEKKMVVHLPRQVQVLQAGRLMVSEGDYVLRKGAEVWFQGGTGTFFVEENATLTIDNYVDVSAVFFKKGGQLKLPLPRGPRTVRISPCVPPTIRRQSLLALEKVKTLPRFQAVSQGNQDGFGRSHEMAARETSPLLRYLHHLAARGPIADVPDGPLLERFARHRDEAVFTALVRRHGPMVLGVCRRVPRDDHAAEDAFQTTFLVLTPKTSSLRPTETLGPWLHGVALRTARRANKTGQR